MVHTFVETLRLQRSEVPGAPGAAAAMPCLHSSALQWSRSLWLAQSSQLQVTVAGIQSGEILPVDFHLVPFLAIEMLQGLLPDP
jgi:hypothetical protein